jgi:hypothetical protein
MHRGLDVLELFVRLASPPVCAVARSWRRAGATWTWTASGPSGDGGGVGRLRIAFQLRVAVEAAGRAPAPPAQHGTP